MTHAPCTTLPSWPHAYPASGARATLKALNEDFIVTELPLQLPCGTGEHLWLDVEKNGANTWDIYNQLNDLTTAPPTVPAATGLPFSSTILISPCITGLPTEPIFSSALSMGSQKSVDASVSP